jgi:hypothetical protein
VYRREAISTRNCNLSGVGLASHPPNNPTNLTNLNEPDDKAPSSSSSPSGLKGSSGVADDLF